MSLRSFFPCLSLRASSYELRALFILLIISFGYSCSKVIYLADTDAQKYEVASETLEQQDSSILQLIAPYKQELEEEMNEVIGYAAQTLEKRQPESTLGNWLADLLHQKAEQHLGEQVDLAITNYGGIRIPSIPEGPIKKGKIFELMPFDNNITILYMEGASLQQFFDHLAARGGWPVSYSVKYSLSGDGAVNISINGDPLAPDQKYTVATIDYVANGGDGAFFLQGLPRKDTGILFRDAIIEYVQENQAKGQSMKASVEGRVVD